MVDVSSGTPALAWAPGESGGTTVDQLGQAWPSRGLQSRLWTREVWGRGEDPASPTSTGMGIYGGLVKRF